MTRSWVRVLPDLNDMLANISIVTPVLPWQVCDPPDEIALLHVDGDRMWESSKSRGILGMPKAPRVAIDRCGSGVAILGAVDCNSPTSLADGS